MMKKWIAIMLSIISLFCLITGCGEDKPAETEKAEASAATDGTAPSVDVEYVPIPELTQPSADTAPPREFPIAVKPPENIPTFEDANNLTPSEFKDILLVGNMSPFTNQFMECEPEEFERRQDVYALSVSNVSDKTIEKLTLVYTNGEKELTFLVEMLPAGWTIVAMDTNGTTVSETKLTYVSGKVEYLTVGRELTDEVELTETMNSTIIVKNMSGEEMKQVIVYYRDVDYQGNVLAGRCFSASTTMELIPGWQEELETDQWLHSCVIVNVILLDEIPE